MLLDTVANSQKMQRQLAQQIFAKPLVTFSKPDIMPSVPGWAEYNHSYVTQVMKNFLKKFLIMFLYNIGVHYVMLDTVANSQRMQRQLAQQIFAKPLVTFSKTDTSLPGVIQYNQSFVTQVMID